MSEPNWATVLRAAYASKGGTVQWVEAVEESHEQRKRDWPFDLREVTELSNEEVDGAITFAKRVDLLSQVGSGVHYELTQKGFDVAHERELRNQQESHNRILAAFTVLVGISALVQAVSVVATQPVSMQLILGFISVTGALAFAYVLKGKAEIFTE